MAEAAASARQTNPQVDVEIPKPSPLRDEDAVVAIRRAGVAATDRIHDLTGELRTVEPGEKLPRRHPMLKRDPEAFVDVTNGTPRERARVALQTVSNVDQDGNVRTIYAGQWADREDALVQANRVFFKSPEDL